MNKLLLTVTLLSAVTLTYLGLSVSLDGSRSLSFQVQSSPTGTVLGANELGQSASPFSAEQDHLVARQVNGQWEIANFASYKKIDVRTSKHDAFYLKRWLLKKGDFIHFGFPSGQVDILVEKVGKNEIHIKEMNSGRVVSWVDCTLDPKESVYQPNVSWRTDAQWRLRNLREKEIHLFSFGGNVNQSKHWMLPSIPQGAARVVWYDGQLWLAPGTGDVHVSMTRPGEKPRSFSDIWLPLDGPRGKVERLVVGRTYYQVDATPSSLTLTPIANQDIHFVDGDNSKLPNNFEKLTWIGQGRSNVNDWLVQSWYKVLALLVIGVTVAWHIRKGHSAAHATLAGAGQTLPVKLVSCVGAVVFLPLSYLVYKSSLDLRFIMFLAWLPWATATVILALNPKANRDGQRLWSFGVLLAFIGLIALFQLAAGADNTKWLKYFQRHSFAIAAFGWLLCLVNAVPGQNVRSIVGFPDSKFELAHMLFWKSIRVIPLVGLLALVAQIPFGNEHGLRLPLFTGQPSELGKLALVIASAIAGRRFLELRYETNKRPLMLLLSIFRLLALVIALGWLALGLTHDYSPIIIMAVFLCAWIWNIAAPLDDGQSIPSSASLKRCKAIRAVIVFVVILFTTSVWWLHEHPKSVQEMAWLPQSDRFQVWAEPDLHPHTGHQVLMSMNLIGRGGWFGAEESWFGRNESGNDLPAVQDDFILSFVIYKFGGVAGLILALTQLGYLWTLFSISSKLKTWACAPGDYQRREYGLILSLIIFGLAWMTATQWAISWGNVLGLIPVMGQPMTWLSAGNSHMYAMAFPTFLMGLLGSIVLSYSKQNEPSG